MRRPPVRVEQFNRQTPEGLSHVDATGRIQMVDVLDKPHTSRKAVAEGEIQLSETAFNAVVRAEIKKGDVFAVSRIAGILAAKKTSDLIPLCHNIPLSGIEVEVLPDETTHTLRILATTSTMSSTGVEMEALTAVSVTALTIYDMCKALDREAEIRSIHLLQKEGGQSGSFHRKTCQGTT